MITVLFDCRCGEVLNGFYFSWVWLHAVFSEYNAIYAELRHLYATFYAIEDEDIPNSCLHELGEVVIILLGCFPKDTDVIIYGSNAGQPVCNLIHPHLEHVLAHL